MHDGKQYSINLSKSKLLGVAVSEDRVVQAANRIGCGVLKVPFAYLDSKVGGNMSRIKYWDEIVDKMVARLSKWKMKTLSIGGWLTLLKAKPAFGGFDLTLSPFGSSFAQSDSEVAFLARQLLEFEANVLLVCRTPKQYENTILLNHMVTQDMHLEFLIPLSDQAPHFLVFQALQLLAYKVHQRLVFQRFLHLLWEGRK
ncbi:hypothetical protein Tco_0450269 [Tanacetum coccineum]